ncbi:cyclic-phosphate processing receiver domain-containing protein [Mycobacteroides abscessus]|uniref:cyclic-phosphate processing receiver domain-containing protein n=1 Tax=Mycobacteroides abscessus TaxID=36809 RepID=UPI00311DD97C
MTDSAYKLWVDDLRIPPAATAERDGVDSDSPWFWAKTSREAIDWLHERRSKSESVEVVSLDHDLGGDDTTRTVVLWMCETGCWPREVRVHTANPVGRQWLEGMVDRYHPSFQTPRGAELKMDTDDASHQREA